MSVLVRTFCCGCDLRTGILLIGLFGLLTSGYGIYSSYSSYKTLKDIDEGKSTLPEFPVDSKYFRDVINFNLGNIAFRAVSMLTSLLLLMSYDTRNFHLAFPWFFWEILTLFYTFALTAFFIAIWHEFTILFVVNAIAWLLSIYFIIVVYSYTESVLQEPVTPARPETGIPLGAVSLKFQRCWRQKNAH